MLGRMLAVLGPTALRAAPRAGLRVAAPPCMWWSVTSTHRKRLVSPLRNSQF